MTEKSSAKKEGESSRPPAWKYQTREATATMGCNVLPYPPNNANLATSDFIFFAPWRKQPQDAVSDNSWNTTEGTIFMLPNNNNNNNNTDDDDNTTQHNTTNNTLMKETVKVHSMQQAPSYLQTMKN
jgi:hypothetical protein